PEQRPSIRNDDKKGGTIASITSRSDLGETDRERAERERERDRQRVRDQREATETNVELSHDKKPDVSRGRDERAPLTGANRDGRPSQPDGRDPREVVSTRSRTDVPPDTREEPPRSPAGPSNATASRHSLHEGRRVPDLSDNRPKDLPRATTAEVERVSSTGASNTDKGRDVRIVRNASADSRRDNPIREEIADTRERDDQRRNIRDDPVPKGNESRELMLKDDKFQEPHDTVDRKDDASRFGSGRGEDSRPKYAKDDTLRDDKSSGVKDGGADLKRDRRDASNTGQAKYGDRSWRADRDGAPQLSEKKSAESDMGPGDSTRGTRRDEFNRSREDQQ
ncbi:hypothetical protein HDU93_005532, partial [Gonapodya sp. JEL0774]